MWLIRDSAALPAPVRRHRAAAQAGGAGPRPSGEPGQSRHRPQWEPWLLALAIASSPACLGTPASSDGGAAALRHRLASIESAFMRSDARRLSSSLTSHSRVRIHLEGLTQAQAFLGPDQVRVVLGGVFARVVTSRFTFEADRAQTSGGTVAFVRSRWTWQDRLTRHQTSQALAFTLRLEAEGWRIIEIRCSE